MPGFRNQLKLPPQRQCQVSVQIGKESVEKMGGECRVQLQFSHIQVLVGFVAEPKLFSKSTTANLILS